MIVVIGGEKGGTGKSTLACNLSVLRSRAGRDVLLLDTDKQGSAAAFAAIRAEGGVEPRISCLQKFCAPGVKECARALLQEIKDLSTRYQDIIIDVGGRDSAEFRTSLVVANRVYVPVQASQFDILTLDKVNEIIAQARGLNTELEAYILINRASTNPSVSEAADAADFIADLSEVKAARSVVRERISFRHATRDGKAVTEASNQDAKACAELIALYEEIFEEPFEPAASKKPTAQTAVTAA